MKNNSTILEETQAFLFSETTTISTVYRMFIGISVRGVDVNIGKIN
jgi:hypothetical protein